MFGGVGKSAELGFDSLGGEAIKIGDGSADDENGEGRASGDGRGAATDFEGRACDAAIVHKRGQAEDVSARRIFDLDSNGGRRQFAHITRVAKMVEQSMAVKRAHPPSIMTRQTLVVAGVLRREGKVLIGQRQAGDRHGLKWEFPGGKVEHRESPAEALRRELREELGIEAVIGRELARYEHARPRKSRLLLMFLRVESFEGEPQAIAFEQIRWEEPSRLPEYDFLDGDLDFVKRMAESAG